MREGGYFTYIMASRSPTLPIGVSGNLQRRVFEHKWKKHCRYNCDRLVWFERHQDHSSIHRPWVLRSSTTVEAAAFRPRKSAAPNQSGFTAS